MKHLLKLLCVACLLAGCQQKVNTDDVPIVQATGEYVDITYGTIYEVKDDTLLVGGLTLKEMFSVPTNLITTDGIPEKGDIYRISFDENNQIVEAEEVSKAIEMMTLEVKSKGTNKPFSVMVPTDWYTNISEDENTLRLEIKGNESEDGYLEILSTGFYGVCGTGLTVKHVKLNHQEVDYGYYDGNTLYSYVLLTPIESPNCLFVWNNQTEDSTSLQLADVIISTVQYIN